MNDEEIARLRRQMTLLQRRLRREVPAVTGISLTAVRVLGEVTRNPEPSQPGHIAQFLAMTGSNVAAALRELEQAGHIERHKDPADARRVLIHVTAQGRAVTTAVRQERTTWLGRAIESGLDADEQQVLLHAGRLFERLAAYDSEEPQAAPEDGWEGRR